MITHRKTIGPFHFWRGRAVDEAIPGITDGHIHTWVGVSFKRYELELTYTR